ncbi:hypothetical protein Bbelb_015750 [Branchiostoma belcheri]|nr:hypothetical protein Bbelb_015750 [Branchiostoma belcheri]
MTLVMTETPGDWFQEYQRILRRLDQSWTWTFEDPRRISVNRPVLKTQEEYQVCPEGRLSGLGETCHEGSESANQMNVDPETGLQQEEEPDFCRQGCVKEDGEV